MSSCATSCARSSELAEAAEEFGKGRSVPYRPRGALEVRAAGRAFLDMRARIERQIEQRTLMLSGVSHDLRTPLTRLRLGLSLMPEDAEVARAAGAMWPHMERMVDEFLAFARGDAMEGPVPTDAVALVPGVVENAPAQGVRLVGGRGRGRAGRDAARRRWRGRWRTWSAMRVRYGNAGRGAAGRSGPQPADHGRG